MKSKDLKSSLTRYLVPKQFPLRTRVISLIFITNLWELNYHLFEQFATTDKENWPSRVYKFLYELKILPHLVSTTMLKDVYNEEEIEEKIEPSQGKSEQQRSEQSSGSQSKASGSKPAEPKNHTNKKREQETNGKKWSHYYRCATTE